MKPLDQNLYPVIMTRTSTRNYSDTPIPAAFVAELRTFIDEAVPLFPTEKAIFDILPHKGSTMKIAAYAKSEPLALMNMAFILQQTDLYVQSKGYGALWNGTVRAPEKLKGDCPYGISLLFGTPRDTPVPRTPAEFKRKEPKEIAAAADLPAVIEVRLAPSAVNRQPWYMVHTDQRIDFYCDRGSIITRTILRNMPWIDMGICLCHAVLALQKQGYSPVAKTDTTVPEKEGYSYATSLLW